MSGERNPGDQQGISWLGPEEAPSGYVPAHQLGNVRDAYEIALSTGRPIEEFISGEGEKDYATWVAAIAAQTGQSFEEARQDLARSITDRRAHIAGIGPVEPSHANS